jgi:hypothetical protein
MGGLGNQLFQIFTTIAYGLRSRRRILFHYSDELTTGTRRPTYWLTFLSALRNFTDENCPMNIGEFPLYREPHFNYSPIPMNESADKTAPLLLYGYFQSYKYFEAEFKTICSFIRLEEKKRAVLDEYKYLFAVPESTITISMHFRLGDYKNLQDFHPLLTADYYRTAIRKCRGEFPDAQIQVLYFCERCDNGVVQNILRELPRDERMEFVKVGDDIADWKQMLIMSCCHSNIIANSTFSWWGAYLNENSEKRVYYPSVWFGPRLSTNNTSQLFPESWIRI